MFLKLQKSVGAVANRCNLRAGNADTVATAIIRARGSPASKSGIAVVTIANTRCPVARSNPRTFFVSMISFWIVRGGHIKKIKIVSCHPSKTEGANSLCAIETSPLVKARAKVATIQQKDTRSSVQHQDSPSASERTYLSPQVPCPLQDSEQKAEALLHVLHATNKNLQSMFANVTVYPLRKWDCRGNSLQDGLTTRLWAWMSMVLLVSLHV